MVLKMLKQVSFRKWVVVSIIGAGTGLLVGILLSYFSEERFVAKTEINSRILYDDIWEFSPSILRQGELLRPILKRAVRYEDMKINEITIASIASVLTNDWLRYLDNVLFRFVIDEAYDSSIISGEISRYAKIQPGMKDGLNQRSVLLRVVASSETTAHDELIKWRKRVRLASEINARDSMKSWFQRKGAGIAALVQDGSVISGLDINKVNEISKQFLRVSDHIDHVIPYKNEEGSVRVEKVIMSPPINRLAMWTLIGLLVSVLTMIGRKANIQN